MHHLQIFVSKSPKKKRRRDDGVAVVVVVVVVGGNQTKHEKGLMGLVGSTKRGHSMWLLSVDEGTEIHCSFCVLDCVSVAEWSSKSHL